MQTVLRRLRPVARAAWRWLREWSGDAAYDRYARRAAVTSRVQRVLSPAEFYVDQVNRRYSHPSRCC